MLGALAAWSFFGILYAKSQNLVLFGTVKTIEFGLLFVYTGYFLRDYPKLLASLKIIALGGFVQSIIAILQYANQVSVGLKILGESTIGKDLPGVAKMVVDGEKIIRPYGTFGHPNILGGFLVFSLISSLVLYLLKEKKALRIFCFMFAGLAAIMLFDHYLVTNQQGQIILWLVLALTFVGYRISDTVGYAIPDKFGYLIIIVQFIALILTYSRTSWLAFGAVVAGTGILLFGKPVWNRWLKLLSIFLLLLIPLFVFLPLRSRIGSSFDANSQAVGDRVSGVQTAFKIIKNHPLAGVGVKNYVINLDDYEAKRLDYWQYQPAHNSYVLIAAESGLVGFGLFVVFASLVVAHGFLSGPSRHDKK